MTLPDRLSALGRIAQLLGELNITYVVGGALAASRWGRPRLTNDVDVVVDLTLEQVTGFVAAATADFHVDEQAARAAVVEGRSFNLIAREDLTKVDVFVSDRTPWQRQQLERGRLESLPPEVSHASVYIASAEDTILAKLVWYEKGNRVSERQWQDVLAIAQVQGDRLDRSYLTEWAADLGVSELLAALLEDAGLGGAQH